MGAQSEGNSPSKASTGPGCRHFCDSASNKSVSLHRVQEAFGISILSVFKDRLILAPQQSPRLHSRRAPPAGCSAGNRPRRGRSIAAPGPDGHWIQKCSLEVGCGRMDSTGLRDGCEVP